MGLLIDSFWRAVAYCMHPRVIALSLLPLLALVACVLGLGFFFWSPVVESVRAWLDSSALIGSVGEWLQGVGLGGLKAVMAPLIVVFAVTPVIVLATLLCVLALMTPALVELVAQRRFPALQRKQGGSLLQSVFWGLGSTVLALIAMAVSLPLWLVPPLILVLPPLIWGWLAYRVMAFDALSTHASADERRTVLRENRLTLLGMGVLSGYLGAAPSVVWAFGAAVAVPFFVLLVPIAIWIYTLVFVFSSLWFAHFCLAALSALRLRDAAAPRPPTAAAAVPELLELENDASLDKPQS